MEAWLRFGRAEMVGERGLGLGDLLLPCLQSWQSLPEKASGSIERSPGTPTSSGSDGILPAGPDGLVGLLEVEQPPRPVTTWSPAAVKHVPFGDAVFTLIADASFDSLPGAEFPHERSRARRKGRRQSFASGPGSPCSSRISRNGGSTWSSRSWSLGRAHSFSGCRWARSGGSSPCRPTPRWRIWSA